MEVKQIYGLVNMVSQEVLGESVIVNENLTNLVDVGTAVFNANQMDNYVRSLVNHIGKVSFDSKVYKGKYPSLLMESWEFGSVLQKVRGGLYEAKENSSWNLQNGVEYSQDTFYKPVVTAKFYNSKVTFEIPISITERQVKESFSNAEQLNAFVSMIYNAVETSMTIKIDGLIQRAINNMIGLSVSNGGSNLAVNLLSTYNALTGSTVTVEAATRAIVGAAGGVNNGFLAYCVKTINMYKDRLSSISTLFNIDGVETFTPESNVKAFMLSEFKRGVETGLLANTINSDYIKFSDTFEQIPFWQGSGQSYSFEDCSTVDIITSTGVTVNQSGVLAVLFDKNAVGVCNSDRRVTTNYNAKAEFFNNYFKYDCQFYNDTAENFVVFYIGE